MLPEIVGYFSDEECAAIKACAEARGMSVKEFVRQAVLECVEDAADATALREAIAADDGVYYSMDEVSRMVGGTIPWDASLFLASDEAQVEYMKAAIESDNDELILAAIRDVARARETD